MAKAVKCPTCGTSIEVTADTLGQVIKCTGCGKQLKLKSKRPPTAPAENQSQASMGGSMSGLTVAGDLPFGDDPPSLDSTCAVCGRPTDPERLVEDNGKLVCPDCIKGARSYRPAAPQDAGLMDLKQAAMLPPRRASIINVGPAFIMFFVAALVAGASQIYLNLRPRPVGKIDPFAVVVKPTATTAPTAGGIGPTTSTAIASPTTEPSNVIAPPTEVAAVPTPTTLPPPTEVAVAPTTPAPQETPAPTTTEVAIAPSVPVTPTEVPPGTAPPQPPAEAPGSTVFAEPSDPLLQGIEKLQKRDFAEAKRIFEQQRTAKAIRLGTERLSSDQQLVLGGLAAARIGLGEMGNAQTLLNMIKTRGTVTRSVIINSALLPLARRATARELIDAGKLLRKYMEAHPGDIFAADVLGTITDRLTSFKEIQPKDLEVEWQFYDRYCDAASQTQPGKLRWGAEWVDAAQVQIFRLSRSKPAPPPQETVERELTTARARVATLQKGYDAAVEAQKNGVPVDVIGAQNQLTGAKTMVQTLEKQLEESKALAQQPHWPQKFDPVIPESTITPTP